MADVKMVLRGLQDTGKIPRRMLGRILGLDLAPLSRHCQLTAPLRSSFSLFTGWLVWKGAPVYNNVNENFVSRCEIKFSSFEIFQSLKLYIFRSGWRNKVGKTWYFSSLLLPPTRQLPFAFTNWESLEQSKLHLVSRIIQLIKYAPRPESCMTRRNFFPW